jgi:BlaI family transcriptional regulator, penicillinase repressor
MKEKKENLQPKSEPTRSELEILKVLWENGPCTVRQVNDNLNKQTRTVQYTSTLKLMQIMQEKGLLKRDESNMKHIYTPTQSEHKTKDALLQKFVENMYKGSAASLVMQLLGNKKTSKKELQAIKDILAKFDKGSK